MAFEPLRRDLTDAGDGRFTLSGNEFALPGTWQVRIDVLVDPFDTATFRTEIAIR